MKTLAIINKNTNLVENIIINKDSNYSLSENNNCFVVDVTGVFCGKNFIYDTSSTSFIEPSYEKDIDEDESIEQQLEHIINNLNDS
jgi:hypothetical protein